MDNDKKKKEVDEQLDKINELINLNQKEINEAEKNRKKYKKEMDKLIKEYEKNSENPLARQEIEEKMNALKKELETQEKEITKAEQDFVKVEEEFQEMMKDLMEQMNAEGNVKIVKVNVPKSPLKFILFNAVVCFILNLLFIIGFSGFFEIFIWEKIFDLVWYSLYFTAIEQVLSLVFNHFFMQLIIKTLGMASLLPTILSIIICVIFPIFIVIKETVLAFILLIIIGICKSKIKKMIQERLILSRRKKV